MVYGKSWWEVVCTVFLLCKKRLVQCQKLINMVAKLDLLDHIVVRFLNMLLQVLYNVSPLVVAFTGHAFLFHLPFCSSLLYDLVISMRSLYVNRTDSIPSSAAMLENSPSLIASRHLPSLPQSGEFRKQ